MQALDILGASEDDIVECDKGNNYTGLSLRSKIMDFINNNDASESTASNSNVESFLKELAYSSDEINDIEIHTISQSNSNLWHEMRICMLTASNFEKICKAVDRDNCPPSLLKLLLGQYGTDIDSNALEWGNKKENHALQLYSRVNKKCHIKPSILKKGLHIDREKPFIGCSPDAIFQCKCHGRKIVEIKCPYSKRFDNPKEVLQVKVQDKEYFYQVQGQMGLLGIDSCDLVLYTTKGISVESIDFDQEFFRAMIEKLDCFFKKYLFPYAVNLFKVNE